MTSSEETVILNMTIEISTGGVVDTGLTVAEWNALDDVERSSVVSELWLDEASNHDNGGVSVATPGAEGI